MEDRTRHVRGEPDLLALEERLANLISDWIAPRLVAEIEVLSWRRAQVLAVQVQPSPSRPHCLERERVRWRVGFTNRRADRELVEELRCFSTRRGVTMSSLRVCPNRVQLYPYWAR